MPTFIGADPPEPAAAIASHNTTATFGVLRVIPGITFDEQQAIVTGVYVSQSCNFQFLHCVGNSVYIYVFGDRIGSIQLNGLALPSIERPGGKQALECGECAYRSHGLPLAYQWYTDHRVAIRDEPVQVHIGTDVAFDAFILSSDFQIIDPISRIANFQIKLATLPVK